MELKLTTLGLILYVALGLFLAAAGLLLARLRRPGLAFYSAAFAVIAIAFVYRWIEVGHVPLQNLFEVFLTLAMLMLPISALCRRFLGVGDEGLDALLAAILLVPAGFIFPAEPQQLPPALQSFLFIPHVSTYMLSYVILMKAAVPAFRHVFDLPLPATEPSALRTPESGVISSERSESRNLAVWAPDLVPVNTAIYRMVSLGFPFLTLGLILGAVWGKFAWGDYWNWDPKELWSLVSWLFYLGYFHFRATFGPRFPRLASLWVLLGPVAIIITLLWINLSRIFPTMHYYAS